MGRLAHKAKGLHIMCSKVARKIIELKLHGHKKLVLNLKISLNLFAALILKEKESQLITIGSRNKTWLLRELVEFYGKLGRRTDIAY